MAKKTKEQFIKDARLVHGDRYDYNKVEYVNSLTKVCIVCPVHGEFWLRASHHLNGVGCSACSGKKKKTSEEFILKAREIHGDKYDYSKVEYTDCKNKVRIICPIHGEFLQTPDAHTNGKRGCPKCKADNSKNIIFGFGINDLQENICLNGKRKSKSVYAYWYNMITRCYSIRSLKKRPTYKGCCVCNEWKYLSNFKKWFDEHYIDGYQLDKDILVKGNKVYSPETCCFVPQEINTLFCKANAIRGNYPIGVSYDKSTSTFLVSFGVSRGRYKTQDAAFNAYKKAKEDYIKEVANKWKDKLEPRVYEALYNYEVEIDD